MLIEQITGNISDKQFTNKSIDTVNIEWYNSQKKIHRLVSTKGRDIAICLNTDKFNGLHQGDVLSVVDNDAITINIIPSKCLVVNCDNRSKLITFCYEVGNRHAPFYYTTDGKNFALPYDKPFEELLQKLHLSFTIEDVCLDNKYRISSSLVHGHSHTHNNGHSHA
ncbi:urease accessory protein UreE [Pectinatus brassicae]|uniref:Urease accessory protein UreE n=1 Tax=Pectinatus brassicae TaxID=862415 RepID=A0A840UPA5_9FIRM|nr:urease accessory protein UreE [Pectinatus brassicae]MBB5336042.1 urease accessory protein [Pectinatus brassicae]